MNIGQSQRLARAKHSSAFLPFVSIGQTCGQCGVQAFANIQIACNGRHIYGIYGERVRRSRGATVGIGNFASVSGLARNSRYSNRVVIAQAVRPTPELTADCRQGYGFAHASGGRARNRNNFGRENGNGNFRRSRAAAFVGGGNSISGVGGWRNRYLVGCFARFPRIRFQTSRSSQCCRFAFADGLVARCNGYRRHSRDCQCCGDCLLAAFIVENIGGDYFRAYVARYCRVSIVRQIRAIAPTYNSAIVEGECAGIAYTQIQTAIGSNGRLRCGRKFGNGVCNHAFAVVGIEYRNGVGGGGSRGCGEHTCGAGCAVHCVAHTASSHNGNLLAFAECAGRGGFVDSGRGFIYYGDGFVDSTCATVGGNINIVLHIADGGWRYRDFVCTRCAIAPSPSGCARHIGFEGYFVAHANYIARCGDSACRSRIDSYSYRRWRQFAAARVNNLNRIFGVFIECRRCYRLRFFAIVPQVGRSCFACWRIERGRAAAAHRCNTSDFACGLWRYREGVRLRSAATSGRRYCYRNGCFAHAWRECECGTAIAERASFRPCVGAATGRTAGCYGYCAAFAHRIIACECNRNRRVHHYLLIGFRCAAFGVGYGEFIIGGGGWAYLNGGGCAKILHAVAPLGDCAVVRCGERNHLASANGRFARGDGRHSRCALGNCYLWQFCRARAIRYGNRVFARRRYGDGARCLACVPQIGVGLTRWRNRCGQHGATTLAERQPASDFARRSVQNGYIFN